MGQAGGLGPPRGLPIDHGRGEVRRVRLSDLDPDAHLGDASRKQRYVDAVFETVAPGYDRFTRLFSFGMDGAWKRELARWAREVTGPDDLVLDLACGTGDLLDAVGVGPRLVVGIDPNAAMLRIARRRSARTAGPPANAMSSAHRPAGPSARLMRADMMSLPVADRIAAAVTVGYGFRNVPDAVAAIREVARVVRPGGWLFDLDFFLPDHPGWRRVYLSYLRTAGRIVGRLRHAEPEAYGYIARSLARWVTPRAFQDMLQSTGFRLERVRRHLGGGICLHAARCVS